MSSAGDDEVSRLYSLPRFKLRKGKSPKRTDRRLESQSRDPVKCRRS